MSNYEDVREQAERLDLAVARLQGDLEALGKAALRESRRRDPDVDTVLGLVGPVRRSDEGRDFARLDLETARGADA